MINFKNYNEVKAAYPMDSIIQIRGEPLQITGYYFDGVYWFPINIVEGYSERIENYFNEEEK